MKGGKKVIIEPHRHQGSFPVCGCVLLIAPLPVRSVHCERKGGCSGDKESSSRGVCVWREENKCGGVASPQAISDHVMHVCVLAE